jgi:glycosyltransferase involved in cell wall biosynthesis
MRVAMLHWAFPPVIGGVEAHLATLCPSLCAKGAEVSLLTASVDGRHHCGMWSGVALARSPLMDLHRLRELDATSAPGAIAREIAAFLGRARPDVVHAHNMHYFSPAHLEALHSWCSTRGVPLVLTAHNVWADELWRRMCARADAWDRVIAVSAYIARELAAAGFPGDRIDVVHHGLDCQRFRPGTPAERRAARRRLGLDGRRVLVHPARTSVAKGSLVAVQALSRLARTLPGVTLVCAGAGAIVDWAGVQAAELERVRAAVRDAGLQDRVLIRSFAWEEMPDLYRAADAVIYPSIFEEPFGLGPLEAMACGVPPVVTRSGGMPEFVHHGQTGLVVPQGDAQALAEACLQLLRDRDRARELGRQARQAVLARHTIAHMRDRTWQVYEAARAAGRAA